MAEQTAIALVLKELKERPQMGKGEIERLKFKQARLTQSGQIVANKDLILQLRGQGGNQELVAKLRKSASRAMSGISVVAIMLPPVSCPYQCTYCPSSKLAAKSYTGYEPAALRARQNEFDAYRQVRSRLSQFEANGHEPQKCELIIMGGTFNTLSQQFQQQFVKGAFDAFNGFESASLQQAIGANESAVHRVVALTIETRPDWACGEKVHELMGLGMTRIELGVQTLDDVVLEKVRRGHGVEQVKRATADCREAFLKVGYHMMPGLFSTPQKDVEMARELFENDEYKPDMLKIYPTLVIPGTELHAMWERGEFEPYDEQTAAQTIAGMKAVVPEYCRIMRIDRDIPSPQIAAGVKKLNLREIVKQKCVEMGIECNCIRCREVGLRANAGNVPINENELELKTLEYGASGGREFFVSFEEPASRALVGFVRVRKPANFGERGMFGVRELRVYGEQVPIGQKATLGRQAQHRQLGSRLMVEAEQLAAGCGAEKLLVTSGAGARGYYRKLGYELNGNYMEKKL